MLFISGLSPRWKTRSVLLNVNGNVPTNCWRTEWPPTWKDPPRTKWWWLRSLIKKWGEVQVGVVKHVPAGCWSTNPQPETTSLARPQKWTIKQQRFLRLFQNNLELHVSSASSWTTFNWEINQPFKKVILSSIVFNVVSNIHLMFRNIFLQMQIQLKFTVKSFLFSLCFLELSMKCVFWQKQTNLI